jgi:hypothetical protein
LYWFSCCRLLRGNGWSDVILKNHKNGILKNDFLRNVILKNDLSDFDEARLIRCKQAGHGSARLHVCLSIAVEKDAVRRNATIALFRMSQYASVAKETQDSFQDRL